MGHIIIGFFSFQSNCFEYRFREWRKWFVVILLLTFPFFFVGGADYYDPRSLKELWNLGHFLFFGTFVLVLDSYWCASGQSTFFRIIATFFVVLIVGFGIELIQLNFPQRTFSLSDVLRDLSGGAAVLLAKSGCRLPRMQSILAGLGVTIVVVANFIPIGGALTDEYRSYKDFPLLSGFESELELSRWSSGKGALSRVSTPRLQGEYSGEITLTTDKYSGMALGHFPGDWSGRSGLAFNVFNPGRQLVLHYRVHDHFHQSDIRQSYTDRFNGRTVLDHGWNEIVIPMIDIINGPKDRKMDVTKISGFGFFVMHQPDRRVLYVDNVRLL